MTTSIKSTALDFQAIKTNLKSHFASQSEFSDYDFEASGLSNILDVLAYNTHMNGLTANFALNEAFLNSAQLRSSVVSHAENLGYYPRSKTASTAIVTLTATPSPTDLITTAVNIPAFTQFTASIDSTTYTFNTTEEHTATNNGSGVFSFLNNTGTNSITIKEGTKKIKTFIAGNATDDNYYVIPDVNVDTSTIIVKVYDTSGSTNFLSYTNIKAATNVTTDSRLYIVRETPNGYYELTFSEGNVLGKAPDPGNKIEVTYLSTGGSTANGASSWVAKNKITIGSNTDVTLSIALATGFTSSAGGADPENLQSIKINAPLAFAAQQRMVTAEDYKTTIFAKYSALLDDVIAWGGQDNIPATFGNVYVSLKFKDSISAAVQTSTKASIKNQLAENLAIMSIDTSFIDPFDTYIETTLKFDFDPDLTGETAESMQVLAKAKIQEYFTENLTKFNTIFRSSLLLTIIDKLSPALLNSSISTKIQRRLTPYAEGTDVTDIADSFAYNTSAKVSLQFPVKLAKTDNEEYRVSSSRFTFSGTTAQIRNKLGTTTLEIYDSVTSAILQDNAGSYAPSSGLVILNDFNVSGIEGAKIKVSIVPDNQHTIKPLRNHILRFDKDASPIQATIDYQNTPTVI